MTATTNTTRELKFPWRTNENHDEPAMRRAPAASKTRAITSALVKNSTKEQL